ncbi:MAG: prenyltransferase [Pseudomonadales bacterium]|nr:prenyltransferase [Pseudomonadales bacterium]
MATEPTVAALPSQPVRWLVATRPGFLSAAVVPVFIGLAAAAQVGVLDWGMAVLTLVGAVVAHAGANVLNDVHDHRTGADSRNVDRVFPYTGGSRVIQNAVLSERTMSRLGWSLLLSAALIGLLLVSRAGDALLVVGMLGLLLGWGYSAPPLRLAYRGAGELAVGASFGVLIPVGASCVQEGRLDPTAAIAGLPYAFLVMLILVVNQFPDSRADAASGKHNWVVRLGTSRGRWLYVALLVAALTALAAAIHGGWLPMLSVIAFAPTLLHLVALKILWKHHDQAAALEPAIEATLRGSLLTGVGISVGLYFG